MYVIWRGALLFTPISSCTPFVLGYFQHLRLVMEDRIPASLEISSGVSTPLADTLLDLILRPVKQACTFSDDQAR